MSGSIGKLAERIRRALELITHARRALAYAYDLIGQAATQQATALRGSHNPEAEQAQALLTQARADTAEQLGILDQAEHHVRSYLAQLGTTDGSASTIPKVPTRPSLDEPPVIPPDRIEALRRELPPPVVPGSGAKTHGCWIDSNGQAHPIISGKDQMSEQATKHLRRLGLRITPIAVPHVETKIAAHMAQHKIKHVTVIVNNVPCQDRLGCDTLVPILLPDGYTLTIHGVTPQGTRYYKRYTGGARPWWR